MAWLDSLLARFRTYASSQHSVKLRYSVVYISVTICASILQAVVGSLSEYRFPHPLLTSELHLLISSATLLILSTVANRLYRTQHDSNRILSASYTTTQSTILQHFASIVPSSPLSQLTPFSLASSLLAVLASLIWLKASRTIEPPFITFTKLLPLLFVNVLGFAVSEIRAGHRIKAAILWTILVAGPGSAIKGTSGEGIISGVLYAVCILSWILILRLGALDAERKEIRDGTSAAPGIFLHLVLSSLLLLVPLFHSGEISLAAASNHFSFFTEFGFWSQEIFIAWCNLASLAAFFGLVKHLNIITALIAISLKDFLLPFAFSFSLGNPLLETTSAATLTTSQQWLTLTALGAYSIAEAWPGADALNNRANPKADGRRKAG